MKIEIDTLALCKRLTSCGFTSKQAEGIVQGLSKTEINNIDSKNEINEKIQTVVKHTLDCYQQQWCDERIVLENRTHNTGIAGEARYEKIEHRLERRVRSALLGALAAVIAVGAIMTIIVFAIH